MSALKSLRVVAFWEGVSFLLLLGIAMPLKYWFAMPLAVRIVGMVHGLLFILFLACLGRAMKERRWSAGRAVSALAAGLVPGGTFFLDAALKREMATIHAGEPAR